MPSFFISLLVLAIRWDYYFGEDEFHVKDFNKKFEILSYSVATVIDEETGLPIGPDHRIVKWMGFKNVQVNGLNYYIEVDTGRVYYIVEYKNAAVGQTNFKMYLFGPSRTSYRHQSILLDSCERVKATKSNGRIFCEIDGLRFDPGLYRFTIQVNNNWFGSAFGIVDTLNSTVVEAQYLLNINGYDAGPADGIIGTKTINAVVKYQKNHDLQPDGEISPGLVAMLRERM